MKGAVTAKRDWLLAFGYVGFIYATLSVVPIPLRLLREHNMLGFTLTYVYGLVFFLLIAGLLVKKIFSWPRILSLAFVISAYLFISRFVSSPEEKIHFLQYGLVGVLFANALRHNIPRLQSRILPALVIATAAGWVDEIIQGILPTRHFDYRDVALNAISILMGLGVYLTYVIPAKKKRKVKIADNQTV